METEGTAVETKGTAVETEGTAMEIEGTAMETNSEETTEQPDEDAEETTKQPDKDSEETKEPDKDSEEMKPPDRDAEETTGIPDDKDDMEIDLKSLSPEQMMELVCKILRECVPSCRAVKPILHARTPVVKFQHKETRLYCDISISNR